MCNVTLGGVQVPLGGSQYGGQYCVNWPNAPSSVGGGFGTMLDCEQNCLAWDCDNNTGLCTQKNATHQHPGQYCASAANLIGGGTDVLGGGTPGAFDIPGCGDNCDLPSTNMCIGGQCTELDINDTACINPNHVLLGGTCIDWVTANAWLGLACNEIDDITCQSPLSQQCGQGCGPCDANPSSQAPFVSYSATTPYLFYDTVIGSQYAGSVQNSKYKYFYDPSPVCDDGIGTVAPTTGPWANWIVMFWQPYDCSPGSPDMTVCGDLSQNNNNDHPCTAAAFIGAGCNNPPLQNIPPPLNQAESRLSSGTCWGPCEI